MPMFFLVVALEGCALSISISFLLDKYNLVGYLRPKNNCDPIDQHADCQHWKASHSLIFWPYP